MNTNGVTQKMHKHFINLTVHKHNLKANKVLNMERNNKHKALNRQQRWGFIFLFDPLAWTLASWSLWVFQGKGSFTSLGSSLKVSYPLLIISYLASLKTLHSSIECPYYSIMKLILDIRVLPRKTWKLESPCLLLTLSSFTLSGPWSLKNCFKFDLYTGKSTANYGQRMNEFFLMICNAFIWMRI